MPIFALFLMWLAAPAFADPLEIVRQVPHSGYSEGLDWKDGFLWHALPKEIVKIDPKDGAVLSRYKPATDYSESLVWVGGKIWNVSYSDNGIYEGELGGKGLKFSRKGSTPEDHAWGFEHDGKHFIVTGNYSNKLYFLDPKTLAVVRTTESPVKDIEDLAWDGVGLWASSYTEHKGTIFRIDPKSGKISRFFTLPNPESCPVIDGLAFDGEHLWLTGKHCTSIFQVKRPSERLLSSEPAKK
jgi:glutamine cyclotransferase